jgi:hypothetical protein
LTRVASIRLARAIDEQVGLTSAAPHPAS